MRATPAQTVPRTREPDGGFHEEIEHTADLALRCGGPDLASFFRSAAVGMYRLMGVGRVPPSSPRAHRISLKAMDVETLLVDWLGELAYHAETRGQVFTNMSFATLTATRLEATLTGGGDVQLETIIKAVTYHDLKVLETPEGFTATVVFDV